MSSYPKVSIIIPSYNGGKFIRKAIRSALMQTYKNLEVIVIDDGSTDDTQEIVRDFSDVIYQYQKNRGVSNARNTGAKLSRGDYLIFLDADDWLFSAAVETSLKYFFKDPSLALVSGCHFKMNSKENEIFFNQFEVKKNNYIELLKSNYIGPPVAAMFVRETFLNYKFNESLKYSEDYELYLRIAKKEKILHHNELVAAYFIHNESISAKRDMLMMENSIKILKKMVENYSSKEELEACKKGVMNWTRLYTNKIYWEKFRDKTEKKQLVEMKFLLIHNPMLFFKYAINFIIGR